MRGASEQGEERSEREKKLSINIFLGEGRGREGGKGERVTCASPRVRSPVGSSPCACGYVGADSSHGGGHICHHLLLKTNEMSLFPIFPPGPFIPIFAPSFRNSFRRKEEGKGSKRREGRAGGEDEAGERDLE